jgi:hypothetical protein
MAYATYEFYINQYKGTALPLSDFEHFIKKAGAFLDYVTFERIKNDVTLISDQIKSAECEMAAIYYSDSQRAVKSEKAGELSYSYLVREIDLNTELYKTAQKYLSTGGLLYRGAYNV